MKPGSHFNSDLKTQDKECSPLVDIIYCAGVNHRTAPLNIREKVAIPKSQLNEFLEAVSKKLELKELVAIFTCNRTEFYWTAEKQIYPLEFFKAIPLVDSETITRLAPLVYSYHGIESARHLFEVTSGLDSMVIGESQVSGQVRDAYEFSRGKNLTGIALNFLFQKAFETTKKVHSQTALLSQKASIPSVALEFARAIFSELSETFVLLIGTGEIAQVTVEVLRKRGAKKVAVLSHSEDRAREFAKTCKAQEIATYDQIPLFISKADIVIACASVSKPLITPKELTSARAGTQKRNRPLLILDLGIPRNVSPEVSMLPQVYLRDIDSLQLIVEKNKEALQAELEKAHRIIETGISDYVHFCRSASAASTIKSIREFAEQIAQTELMRTFGKMPELSESQKALLQELVHRILGKILHNPSERLRFLSGNQKGQPAIHLARILFGLDPLDSLSPDADSIDNDKVSQK